ncbi:MAG: hypothetical protein GY782_10860 [Gammaproteobacteria bacterium]|nr:hypothetical protein [Gammaproteobacteria bacterium]
MDFYNYLKLFIWNYAAGDNAAYNYEVSKILINIYKNNNNHMLIKPIVISTISIMERILFDFLHRIYESRHGLNVPRIGDGNLESIRKWVDKKNKGINSITFQHLIGKFSSVNIMKLEKKENHEFFRSLIQKRNRIHIPKSEKELYHWKHEDVLNSCNTLASVCKYLVNNHARIDLDNNNIEFPKLIE